MKRIFFILLALIAMLGMNAQPKKNYYDLAMGKKGEALKTALHKCIKTHTTLSYSALWEKYKETDVRSDGKIWDVYSCTTSYEPGGPEQGRSYKKEGDSYNREHSVPQSWFNKRTPMKTDLFHVLPTDGYVNNRRSNFPYGETSNPTYTSNRGFSKLGPSSLEDYKGIVFEPNDEYKGDIARIYFYMVTCYEDRLAEWNSPMISKGYPCIYDWARNMLLRWAKEDPISQKEIDRNNKVEKAQGNRNPFVDFPGLEDYIWGDKMDVAFNPNEFLNPGEDNNTDPTEEPTPPEAPTITPNGGEVEMGTQVTISCETPKAAFFYSIVEAGNDLDPLPDPTTQTAWIYAEAPVTITISSDCTIAAFSTKNNLSSTIVEATFTVTEPKGDEPTVEQRPAIFKRIENTRDLTTDRNYIIVNESKGMALGKQRGNVRDNVSINIVNGTTDLSFANEMPTLMRLEAVGSYFAFYIPSEQTRLAIPSDANSLTTDTNGDDTLWKISISNGTATISNDEYKERSICYNISSPRFATYKSTSKQAPVQIYGQTASSTTGIDKLTNDKAEKQTTPKTYDMQGRRVNHITKPGVYILGNKKFVNVR